MNKKYIGVAAVLLIALAALAGPIKTWSAGEVIVASDLNANFQHIHNLMVGGHGGRLVNADVAANANIAVSKLAINRLTPVAWAASTGACLQDGGSCAYLSQVGFDGGISPSGSQQGSYTLTLATARPNTSYAVIAAANTYSGGTGREECKGEVISVNLVNVNCRAVLPDAGFGFLNSAFSVTVFDND
jgi:hypothetical protein